MENTVLYLEYYLGLREAGYSHEASLLSVTQFMRDQIPETSATDFQVSVWTSSVIRVCNRVNNMMAAGREEV